MRTLIIISLSALLTLSACTPMRTEVRSMETSLDSAMLSAGELQIAESALQSGDTQVALSLYRELSRAHPENIAVWLGLGDTYYLDNELELAQQAYTRAELIDPQASEPKISLARVAIRLRQFELAQSKLGAVLAEQPNHPIALASQGVIYDLTQQPERAQQTYKKGLQANPGNHALRSNLGLSLALNGKPREAVNVLLGHTGVPSNLPQARENLALAYGLLGRDDAAEEILLGGQSRGQVLDNLEFYRFLRGRLTVTE